MKVKTKLDIKDFTTFEVDSSADMEVNLVISKVTKLISHSPFNLIYF